MMRFQLSKVSYASRIVPDADRAEQTIENIGHIHPSFARVRGSVFAKQRISKGVHLL
jgi:hypothetical protein